MTKLCIVFALTMSCAFAASFDAVSGFSPTTNTATNTWSYYGSASTNVSTFGTTAALLPVFFNGTCGGGANCWDTDAGISNLILQNVTGATVGLANANALNNQLTYFTRSGLVDVRFLVPTTGTYSLTGFFEGGAIAPESSQEFIAIDGNVGSPLFNMTGAVPLTNTNPFSFASLSLTAGDTVDFIVAGISTTADKNTLATGFDATFTQLGSSVPEPGTFSLLAGGLILLGYVRRKR